MHTPNGDGETTSRSTLESETKRHKEWSRGDEGQGKADGDSFGFCLLGVYLVGLVSEMQQRRRKLHCPAIMSHMCLRLLGKPGVYYKAK